MRNKSIVAVMALCSMLLLGWYYRARPADSPRGSTTATAAARDRIEAAIEAELPNAKRAHSTSRLASRIEAALAESDVRAEAARLLVDTEIDHVAGGNGIIIPEKRVAVAISTFWIADDLATSFARGFDGGFEGQVRHYSAQSRDWLDRGALDGVVYLYLAVDSNRQVTALIGLSEPEGVALRPRQLPEVLPQVEAGPARCDVTSELDEVPPGQGYLIDPADVLRSDAYIRTIPSEILTTWKDQVARDTSPWLVCEKHIDMFDVDRKAAHDRALEMWKRRSTVRSGQAP